MQTQILSLNFDNLKKFIASKVPSIKRVRVSYIYPVPIIIYNKLLQMIEKKQFDVSIKFITKKNIVFKNQNYHLRYSVRDESKYYIIDDIISSQLSHSNLDPFLKKSDIECQLFANLLQINDKLFQINVYSEIDKVTDNVLIQPSFENNQIIVINDAIHLVAQNDASFYFEFNFSFDADGAQVARHIKTLQQMIFFNKEKIIENNIYVDKYREMIGKKHTEILATNNPVSILIEHLLDKIGYNHCIFQKTDGDRVNIMLFNSIMCYLDSNLDCYFVAALDNSSAQMLFDAELYEEQFFVFDLLYSKDISNIDDYSLANKLKMAADAISRYKLKNVHVKSPVYYGESREKFFEEVVKMVQSIKGSDIKFDGLIFQSVLSRNKSLEKGIRDYKWKHLADTSLDFFIKLSPKLVKSESGVFFKIDLFGYALVTDEKGNAFEEPKFFGETYVRSDGQFAVTLNNEIMHSNIVVEFNPEFDDSNNLIWTPYRIRYDKTLAVLNYKRKHGNQIQICEQTLEYLKTPILEEDFALLADNYEQGYGVLAQKIKDKKIVTKKDPVNDRIFDFVKTNIITTFGRYLFFTHEFERIDMIDVSCKTGIDLFKIYQVAVLFKKGNFIYHGFSDSRIEIESTFNGARSRYDKFRNDRTFSNFPICEFFIADVNAMLESVTKKYNHLLCFDFFKFQRSYSSLMKIKALMDKVLVAGAYAFVIVADIKDNKESNSFIQNNVIYNYTVFKTLQDVRQAFGNYVFVETQSFLYHLQKLNQIKDMLQRSSNRKTAEFLFQTLGAFNKVNFNIFDNLHFCILRRAK